VWTLLEDSTKRYNLGPYREFLYRGLEMTEEQKFNMRLVKLFNNKYFDLNV
jgi:hypothetical protein